MIHLISVLVLWEALRPASGWLQERRVFERQPISEIFSAYPIDLY